MKKTAKKRIIIIAAIIAAIVIIVNIPIVSDVIAMAGAGMLSYVADTEKTSYEGENYWQFTLDKTASQEKPARVIVVEHSVLKATVEIFEDDTGKVNYYTKPLFGKPSVTLS